MFFSKSPIIDLYSNDHNFCQGGRIRNFFGFSDATFRYLEFGIPNVAFGDSQFFGKSEISKEGYPLIKKPKSLFLI